MSSKQFVFHPMLRLKTRTRLCVCFKMKKATDLLPVEAMLLRLISNVASTGLFGLFIASLFVTTESIN